MNRLKLGKSKQSILALFLIMLCHTFAIAAIEIGNTINPHPGASDGMISVRLSGKARPFKIRLEGPVSYAESDANEPLHTFDGLSAGMYTIIVIDKQGCQTTLTYELKEFLCDLAFNITNIKHVSYCSDNALCGDQGIVGCTADGSIEIEVISSNDYAVYLNGTLKGDNLTVLSGLDSDNYTIQVINKSDETCLLSDQFQILFCKQYNYVEDNELRTPNESSKRSLGNCVESEGNVGAQFLSIETLKAQGTTGGICNGELVFDIQANLDGYVYYIKNSQGERFYDVTSLSNLCPDNYCMVVDNGCQVEQICREIADCTINPLILKPSVSNPCIGTSKGKIFLNIEGGKAPYTYEWSTGSTEQDLVEIPAGTYAVTVTDFNLCQETTEIIVEEEPNTLNVEIDVNPFSQYSFIAEIIIKVDGPEDRYSLYMNGEEYGSLRSGKAELFEFERISQNIDKIFLIEIFSSSGCGYTEEVTLADCETSIDKLQIEVMRSNDNACNGGNQLVDVLITGGAPPYKISASSTPLNAGDPPVFESTKIVYEEGLATGIILAPEARIIVEVTDICGNVVSQGLTICDGNCWVYSERQSSDEITYFVTDFLKFKVKKGCFTGNIRPLSQLSTVEVEMIDGIENNPTLTNRLESLKIIWPDGRSTGLEIGAFTSGGSIRRLDFVGINGFIARAAGKYTIKVEWTPEDEATCTMEFEIEFFDGGIETYGFQDGGYLNEPWKDAYFATYKCKSCLPSTSNSNYVTDDRNCRDESFWEFEYFDYIPTDINNPCHGGGTFQAWTRVNDALELRIITVPPNMAISQIAFYGGGNPADGVRPPNNFCRIGARCLFDAKDVLGIELDKPLVMGWCGLQEDLPDPPPMEEGDDVGDVWDEEEIDENCMITEEPDEADCDINTYCNTEDGQQILLDFRDGPNVVICRFITRSGNCHSLRGRCNCQPEVTNGQEIVRIDDPTGELCDSTEKYMTCAEYHATNNCRGPNGQGTGGSLIDDSPSKNLWFLTSSVDKIPTNKILYPNPFTNEINISISAEVEKELTFSIMDIYGVVIFEDYKKLVSGQNIFTFHQLANYPNGIYYIAVADDITGDTEVKKVIKASNY